MLNYTIKNPNIGAVFEQFSLSFLIEILIVLLLFMKNPGFNDLALVHQISINFDSLCSTVHILTQCDYIVSGCAFILRKAVFGGF